MYPRTQRGSLWHKKFFDTEEKTMAIPATMKALVAYGNGDYRFESA